MPKFDYYFSAKRKNFLQKHFFSGTAFTILSLLNICLLVIVVFLCLQNNQVSQGWAEILFALILLLQGYYLAKRFVKVEVASNNLADRFSLDLIKLIELVIQEARKDKVVEITPEYFFSKISLSNEGRILCARIGLPFADRKNAVPTNLVPRFSVAMVNILANLPKKNIEIADVLEAIVTQSESAQQYLDSVKVSLEDVQIIVKWIDELKLYSKKPKFWEDSHVLAGVGQDWSFGYSPVLSSFSTDISRYFNDPNLTINTFGHSGKVTDIQSILAKPTKNNVLLVGEPGVGKKTIVNALALKLAQGDCLPVLKYKRIRQLDVGRILAGGGMGDWTERLEGCLSDAVEAGNIILYIDNFQSLIGGGASAEVGGVDASQILIPFLEQSGLKVIASISPNDYYERLKNKEGVSNTFEKIDVAPASTEDTKAILLETIPYIETKYKVFFPFQTLKTTVDLSDRYIHDVPLPEKALRLMEQAAVTYGSTEVNIVWPDDMEKLISQKTNVPIGQVQEEEKNKLLNLESFLHQRVIGQEEAISAIANSLRRVRSGLASGKRPVGVFLFLGPTGVGKTETAKALAESYFGSEKQMIRLDMSEYQQPDSVDRLIGSQMNPNGVLTDAIAQTPFSLILLDEIEKADKNVLNIFLQVFEDGRLTDARGHTSDFTNAIIIATSNAGSELIRERVQENVALEGLKEELINTLQQKGMFTPEFLNRFDNVVVYKPLSQDQLTQVAQLMIGGINKTLEEKRIHVDVDPIALKRLVELGYDPQFGARPMRRVIQEKVENLLAKRMLEGSLSEHETIKINLEDLG